MYVNQPNHGLDPQLSEAIFGTIREPMVVLTKELRVIIASRSFYEKFQTTFEDTQNKLFYELGNGQWDIPALRTLLMDVIPKKRIVEDYEVEHEFEHIGKRTILMNARELRYENGQKKMLLTLHDVTDARADQEHKQMLMVQKDTLLKEMRHRIANSLQLIASIILLKAQTVPSAESRMHLEDAHDRILSIATVQRNLDPTDSGTEVPVTEYLKTLCTSLAKSMIGGRKPIIITVEGDASTILPDKAISLGLITTELVINSLKHAFPSGEGEITVSYHVDGRDWALVIKDNGIGYSAEPKIKTEGLGTSIVESLGNQIKATIKRESSRNGTTVSITGSAT